MYCYNRRICHVSLLLYEVLQVIIVSSFRWNSEFQPSVANIGDNITLQWTYSLANSEKETADRFALLIIEQERYLYSNEWMVVALKQPRGGFERLSPTAVGLTLLQRHGAALVLTNVSYHTETRYRCTFFSGFSAPMSTILPDIKDPILAVRLAGSTTAGAGRVEIKHNGYWGTICTEGWGLSDARVTCHMLGYQGAKLSTCGGACSRGEGPIWMSSLQCKGSETSLIECAHSGWGKHKCNHDMDAGVVCYPAITTITPPSTKTATTSSTTTAPTTTQPSTTKPLDRGPIVRLTGVNHPSFGRLEVKNNGVWGTVCSDNWDNNDAIVVCRMLNYRFVKHSGLVNARLRGNGSILLDEVQCNGTERSILECLHNGWGVSDCDHSKDVGVWCTNDTQPTPALIQVRVAGSHFPYAGRLEVLYNGTWGTVCANGWSNKSAEVACKMLGYPYVWTSGSVGAMIPGSGRIWLQSVNCSGSEASLAECPHGGWGEHNCSHVRDVGVFCGNTSQPTVSPPTTPTSALPVRLRDGNGPHIGRVEVFLNGAWGTVCGDLWDDKSGLVACRMLGYKHVWFSGIYGTRSPGTGHIWLDDVRCHGNESSLVQCSHRPFGTHNCGHDEDAGVACGNTPTMMPSIDIRLTGGNSSTEGRIEVFFSNQSWGTICDDDWGLSDANVVCRMLGLPGAVRAVTAGKFGPGRGRIWLDNVGCHGDETTIGQCAHNGWGKHDCSHKEDAGVVCTRKAVAPAGAGCDFSEGLCYWQNTYNGDQFDWVRRYGPTPSSNTGPAADHTNGNGYYLHIETTINNPNDVAKLISPLMDRNATCMVFYYHMYGNDIATLRVKAGDRLLWELSGNQGNKWNNATVSLSDLSGLFEVSVEGVHGRSFHGDIAIDDISFKSSPCNTTAESTVPSRITQISAAQEVGRQGNFTINCVASGLPTPAVKLLKSANQLASGQGRASYTLYGAKVEHSGEYVCVAINLYGNATRTTVVFVRHEPINTQMTFNVSNSAAMLNETVAITCSTRAFPKATCGIYHRRIPLSSSHDSFVIAKFSSAYQGVYNCTCYNVYGLSSAVNTLTVYEKPKIHTLHPTLLNINETDPFTIHCNATGNPEPNISWRKHGSNSRVYASKELLAVPRSSREDEGVYTCVADNGGQYHDERNVTVNVNFRVPRLVVRPDNVSMIEDALHSTQLFCNATGIPLPKITWFKVGNPIPVANGTAMKLSATRNNMGDYICEASNGIGDPARAIFFFLMKYKPYNTVLKTDRTNDVVLGNGRVILVCTADASPPVHRYFIYRNGIPVGSTGSGFHVIPRAKAEDQGTYLCIPENALGNGTNATVTIHVFGSLMITDAPKNVTVKEGAEVRLFCNATSVFHVMPLPASITWAKVDNTSVALPPGKSLLLTNVNRLDMGTYECQARNGIAHVETARAYVNILHKPTETKITSTATKNTVFVNDSVQLMCTTLANPAVTTFKFFRDGLSIGERSNGVYNMTRVRASDNGTYQCVAENSMGKGPQTSMLLIIAAPCGVRPLSSSIKSQIVGGVTTQHGSWPWQVQMGYEKGAEVFPHICGGSIVSRRWIVTAAHCVTAASPPGSFNYTTFSPSSLNIVLGEHFLGRSDGTEQKIKAERIVVHPSYVDLDYDIAMVKLQQPIQYNAHVSQVCLPTSEMPVGTSCYVSGWGRVTRNSAVSSVLQEASIPLVAKQDCINQYKSIKTVTNRMRCAGIYGMPKGTCKGDSGGPLVCARNGRWMLMGVTSWSLDGCADSGYAGVYADVLYFKDWVTQIKQT